MSGKDLELRPRRLRPARHSFVLWLCLLVGVAFLVWATATGNPMADGLQRLVKRSHNEDITPSVFTIEPGGYASYRLVVPTGASRVSVRGQFTVTDGGDKNIEVYLLSDGAFVDWQNGYLGDNYYTSGKVGQGGINATLPTGGATYYLVFSNRSAKTPKSVQSSVTLSYDRWWPIL